MNIFWSLAKEFRDVVSDFVDSKKTFDELYDWLAMNTEALDKLHDPHLEPIEWEIWGWIGEHGYGHRSVESMREAAKELLKAWPTATYSVTSTGTSSVTVTV